MPINCVHGFLEDALLCSFKIPKKTQSNLINLKINIVARGKKSNCAVYSANLALFFPGHARVVKTSTNLQRLFRSCALTPRTNSPSYVGRHELWTQLGGQLETSIFVFPSSGFDEYLSLSHT